jgi:hypothetical protein
MGNKLAELHLVPGLAPIDQAATAKQSDVIGVKEGHEIEFDILFGVITGDSVVVTIEECDDTTPTNSTAIAFRYQKSSAVGTDAMGAVTAATSSGVTIAATDDNKVLRCFVDPSALSSGYPYVRAVVTPGASMTVCLVAILAIIRDRYPQEVPISAVD